MSYIGIDYSLGRSNFNPATGIHFGVISQHSINGDALGDIESDYGDPSCPKCGNAVVELDEYYKTHPENADPDDEELKNYTEHGCADYACDHCKLILDSQYVTPDEPIGLKYERNGYKITDCLDSDLFILESPFYTHAQYCSPCVPGAGSLDNPIDGGPKTYCLGHDWFEDGKAPYPVFNVKDDSVVES